MRVPIPWPTASRPTIVTLALAASALFAFAGCARCSGEDGGSGPAAAARLYAKRCAVCHGERGRGDGRAARSFTPRPRSFADRRWQARTSVAAIRRVILEGGAARGKSPLMPPHPDLAGKPVLDALIAHIRAFAPVDAKR